MTLLAHVAAHPDVLVGLLCDELARPSGDTFAGEMVAVPTRGIERWLTQRIGSELGRRGAGDGVCANVRFPSPDRLVDGVLGAVPDLASGAQAWSRPALAASLVAAIDAHIDQPWTSVIARHLQGRDNADGATPGRLSVARKVARLFDGYARRRPGMIRAWAAGDSVGPDGGPLGEGAVWQMELWRVVRDQIGVSSPPELLPGALDPIRSDDVALDLPERVLVYGLTAVDPLDLEVLDAVGSHREVHLYLLHPSPALWERCAPRIEGQERSVARADHPTAGLAEHPMLRSWGQDSRELQVVLGGRGITTAPTQEDRPPAKSLLGRLQQDIGGNRPATHDPGLAGRVESGEDRSIQVHVCHGARRQVEVLRDAILHLLSSNPSLQPRDVAIMTPDLATFAPLLEAAFLTETTSGDGLPDLRVRIADRSPAATNPLVRFAATIFDLADSRLEGNVVRELVTRPVVQQRFGIDAELAAGIATVIDHSNVRWGLDGADRARWGASENDEGTWRRGLDRALTGLFYSDSPSRVIADIAPLDGVEGQEATPVGLLAAIIDRITAIRHLLSRSLPTSAWAPTVASAVGLLAAPGWGDEWQWRQLERLLEETFPPAKEGIPDPQVSLAEARGAVTWWVEDRPSPLHFRTGDITVCTLVPMRSVPYRVVCLLGMDDERFPRSSRSDGDDLLVGNEAVGDHDAGAEDRQLLLDAVIAAGAHLLVTYSGRDELTNAQYPPAVPVAELVDTVRDMVGDRAAGMVVTEHPLQSFAEANFVPGALGVSGSWGFDPIQHAGAVAAQHRRTATTPTSPPVVWPEVETPSVIPLDDLIRFLQHPADRFLRSNLGFSIPKLGATPDDRLPVELDALSRWAVTNRILSGLIAGHDLDALAERERAGDGLPPGDLGAGDLETSTEAARILWVAAQERGYHPDRQRPWQGTLGIGDRVVEGSVLADGDRSRIVTVTPSRLKAKVRLRAFVEMVFLSGIQPDIPWEAMLLGRGSGPRHQAVTLGPIADHSDDRNQEAVRILTDLVDLYLEGHRGPLPIPCETAYAWHRHVSGDRGRAFREAKEAWEGTFGERTDGAHSLLFPHLPTVDDLLTAGLAGYCSRLWGPVLPLMRERTL